MGGVQAESSPGSDAVGTGTQESHPGVFGMLVVSAECVETPNSAGEVGVSSPSESTRSGGAGCCSAEIRHVGYYFMS